MPAFDVGARVVVPVIQGHCGLGTVVDVTTKDGDRYNVVQLDSLAKVAPDSLLHVLVSTVTWPWPVPSADAARGQLARMLTPAPPDERDWKARHKDFTRLAAACDPDGLLAFARGQWSRPGRPPFGESAVHRMLTAMVVAPVADALGMETEALRAKILAAVHR